ncbi:MAG: DNA-processing protein DprA [Pseudomonadota bacterium]
MSHPSYCTAGQSGIQPAHPKNGVDASELIARIQLNALIPRHPNLVARLILSLGSAQRVVQAPMDQLRAAGVPNALVTTMLAFRRSNSRVHQQVARQVEMSHEWMAHADQTILIPGHPHWPALLNEIYDPPVLLYVRGEPNCLNVPCLAMVGSRNTSLQDRELATMLAARLSPYLCIVSGLALGVDAASHHGAVSIGNRTCAVLGHGCDLIYPRTNRRLAETILAESGALLSSFPLGMSPHPAHFPQRNRIITGLSLGTIVVAAQPSSGSMISARLALEQGRLVFAVPGSIIDDRHAGCHQLIRDGAAIVTRASDILEELAETTWLEFAFDEFSEASPPGDDESKDGGPQPLQHRVMSLLSERPMPMDEIAARFPGQEDDITTILVDLEIDGQIVHQPGGYTLGVDGVTNMG